MVGRSARVCTTLLCTAFDAVYTAFVLPVTVAFSSHTVHGPLGVSSTVAGTTVQDFVLLRDIANNVVFVCTAHTGMVYLLDFLLNLQTGIVVTFLTQRAVVLDPQLIARYRPCCCCH